MEPFAEADTDGDGTLSADELRFALEDAGSDASVGDTMAAFDADGELQLERAAPRTHSLQLSVARAC